MSLESILKRIKDGGLPDGELRIRNTSTLSVKDEHLDPILTALEEPNDVIKLLIECDLSETAIKKLADFLVHNTQIESFDLWNTPQSFKTKNTYLRFFTDVIETNKTLRRLGLSGIGVEYCETTQFFEVLTKNTTLKCFSLYSNCFRDHVSPQVAELISKNSTLKSLSLSGHLFSQNELKLIAGALESNTTLEALDFSGFSLRDEGEIVFASQLAKNKTLKILRLFCSGINAEGAIAFANSLTTNTHLEELDLGCNSITKKGSIAIAKALEENNSLRKLSVGPYSTDDEGLTAFANLFNINTSLIFFDYDRFNTSGNETDKLRIDIGLIRNRIAFDSSIPMTLNYQHFDYLFLLLKDRCSKLTSGMLLRLEYIVYHVRKTKNDAPKSFAEFSKSYQDQALNLAILQVNAGISIPFPIDEMIYERVDIRPALGVKVAKLCKGYKTMLFSKQNAKAPGANQEINNLSKQISSINLK